MMLGRYVPLEFAQDYSCVLGAQQMRRLDHRLHLAERDLARQVLHAAVGREDHVFRLDVTRAPA